ncbi:hypothetical protein QYM36_011873 [Artemia franciscana]|nr:hypothetical protein QYM36_011873 [Artemia franciscana]
MKRHESKDFPRFTVDLPGSIICLSFSPDESNFLVIIRKDGIIVATVYKSLDILNKSPKLLKEIRLTQCENIKMRDAKWNPGDSNTFAVCTSDGVVGIYSLRDGTLDIAKSPPSMNANAICWSPKGKQVVIGRSDGQLFQCKPDMSVVKKIPPPEGHSVGPVVGLLWVSNFQFVCAYVDCQDPRPFVYVVNTPKNEPITYIPYDDVCFGSGSEDYRYQFYHLSDWGVIICCSATASELAVLGLADGDSWSPWLLDDSGRAEVPMKDGDERYPVGLSVDYSRQEPLPFGETEKIPPAPVLMVMSSAGILTPFHIINVREGAKQLTAPPSQPLKLPTTPSQIEKELVLPAPPQQVSEPILPLTNVTQTKPSVFATSPAFTLAGLSKIEPSAPVLQPKSSLFSTPINSIATPSIKPFGIPSSTGLFGTQAVTKPAAAGVAGTERLTPEAPSRQDLSTLATPSFQAKPSEAAKAGTKAVELALKGSTDKEQDEFLVKDFAKFRNQFQEEVDSLKERIAKLNVQVGSEDDKRLLNQSIYEADLFNRELQLTLDSHRAEISSLRSSTSETLSSAEECKNKMDKRMDPRQMRLLQLRGLDPASRRILKRVTDLHKYLTSGIDQVQRTMDTLSFDGASAPLKLPDTDYMYKSLHAMERIINEEKIKLSEVSGIIQMLQERKVFKSQQKDDMNRTLENLERSLSESKISADRKFTLQKYGSQPSTITSKWQASVKAQLQSQPMIETKATLPLVPNVIRPKFEEITPPGSPIRPTVRSPKDWVTSTPKVDVARKSTDTGLQSTLFPKSIEAVKDRKMESIAIPRSVPHKPAFGSVTPFSLPEASPKPTVSFAPETRPLISDASLPPNFDDRAAAKSTTEFPFPSKGSIFTPKLGYAKAPESVKTESKPLFYTASVKTEPSSLLSRSTTLTASNLGSISQQSIQTKPEVSIAGGLKITSDVFAAKDTKTLFKSETSEIQPSVFSFTPKHEVTQSTSVTKPPEKQVNEIKAPVPTLETATRNLFGTETSKEAEAKSITTKPSLFTTFSVTSSASKTNATEQPPPLFSLTGRLGMTEAQPSAIKNEAAPAAVGLKKSLFSFAERDELKTIKDNFLTEKTSSKTEDAMPTETAAFEKEVKLDEENLASVEKDVQITKQTQEIPLVDLQPDVDLVSEFLKDASEAQPLEEQQAVVVPTTMVSATANDPKIPVTLSVTKPSIFASFAPSSSATTNSTSAATGAFGHPIVSDSEKLAFGAVSRSGLTQVPADTAAPTTSVFGQPNTTTAVGQATTLFGQSTTSAPIFGQPPPGTGVFGQPTTAFQQPSPATTPLNIFGGFDQKSAMTSANGVFGQNKPFGQVQQPGFGNKAIADTVQSLFGSTAGSQPQASATGNAFTNFGRMQTGATGSSFGTAAGLGAFGLGGQPSEANKNRNVFGGGAFGAGAQQTAGIFGGSPAQPSVFGGTNQATPSKPAFGSPAFGSAKFGGAPSFGGSPSFGSPAAFGSPSAIGASSGSVFANGASTGTGNVFEAFAAKNTPTFGSIATSTTEGSQFGMSRQQPSTFGQAPAFGGGSSFSSWR